LTSNYSYGVGDSVERVKKGLTISGDYGEIIEIDKNRHGKVRVHWDCDDDRYIATWINVASIKRSARKYDC